MKPLFYFALFLIGFAAAAGTNRGLFEPKFPGKHTFGDGSPVPATAQAFEKMKDQVGVSWDDEFLYLEGNGLPSHEMMTGITAWQQQVPIPHDFTGDKAFKLPLKPEVLEKPGELTLIGPIAIAVNGIPIFHALTQSGKDAYAGGELDQWGGHCGRADDYHYHIAPTHLEEIVGKGNPVAFGLDGFPIYAADPSRDKPLDECHGYFDDEGNYRYVGEMKPPYVMSYFRGKADLEARPRTQGVRQFLRPLRGAKITGFSGSLDDGFHLDYDVNGSKASIDYQITQTAGVEFAFTDADGTKREETHERRAGGGDRPPRPDGNQPPPPRRPGGGGVRDPLLQALDRNRDGTIDANEIREATASLKKLDRDGDGKLNREEATGRKPGGKGKGNRPR